MHSQLAKAIEGTPAGSVVSLADLVMLAGAYAVELCNGPKIEVRSDHGGATLWSWWVTMLCAWARAQELRRAALLLL
eukprot:scaffold99939_cov19-Tisochrysis_lutea.AAC.1